VAGMAALRGAAGPPFRNPQQIERAVARGQVAPGEVELPGGRIEGAVAEQEWAGGQLPPGCQPLCGQTMPSGMDPCAVGDPRAPLGVGGDLVRGGDGQGLGAVVSRQAPRRGAVERPGGAQCGPQPGRQQGGRGPDGLCPD